MSELKSKNIPVKKTTKQAVPKKNKVKKVAKIDKTKVIIKFSECLLDFDK
jgi:hypothetical protein